MFGVPPTATAIATLHALQALKRSASDCRRNDRRDHNDGLLDSALQVTQATIGDAGGGGAGAVDAFLSYVTPTDSRVELLAGTTSFDVTIIYGPGILPATFEATLNGQPFAGFAPVAGTMQTVTIPLASGRNVLVLRVDGENATGRIATDRDRLTLVVSRR